MEIDEMMQEIEQNIGLIRDHMLKVFSYTMPVQRHMNEFGVLNQEVTYMQRGKALEICFAQQGLPGASVIQVEILSSIMHFDDQARASLQADLNNLAQSLNQIKMLNKIAREAIKATERSVQQPIKPPMPYAPKPDPVVEEEEEPAAASESKTELEELFEDNTLTYSQKVKRFEEITGLGKRSYANYLEKYKQGKGAAK